MNAHGFKVLGGLEKPGMRPTDFNMKATEW
jgi:hypothetical protein